MYVCMYEIDAGQVSGDDGGLEEKIFIYIYICVYVYIFIYVCIHICNICVDTRIHIYVCLIYIHIYTYIRIMYIYIHICTLYSNTHIYDYRSVKPGVRVAGVSTRQTWIATWRGIVILVIISPPAPPPKSKPLSVTGHSSVGVAAVLVVISTLPPVTTSPVKSVTVSVIVVLHSGRVVGRAGVVSRERRGAPIIPWRILVVIVVSRF